MERNLTTGSVGKNILIFSLPYLLSYFLQTLYGMADLFIIGQFDGVASTTAVSIGSQVMHMLTVMLVGLAMGTTVSIARAVGGRNHKQVSENVGNTVTLFFGLSIVLTVVLLLLVRPIVGVMSTPAEAVDGTVAYLTICFLGIPFITAYNIISSIFRGMGDSKSPMYFIAIACAANIMLDYLFIGALDFGPAGAALGTTLAQTISVAVSLFMILRRKSISLSKGDFHPRRPVVGQILQIGVPVALQDGLIQIAFIVITIIANRRGLNDAAAVGIVEKIIGFVFLVPSSMLSTVSALGAQNIGAGQAGTRCTDPTLCNRALPLASGFASASGYSSARNSLSHSLPTDRRQAAQRSFASADNTCAAISSTAFLQGFILASAAISAPAASRFFPSCTTSVRFCLCVYRGPILLPCSSPIRCSRWGWLRQAVRCFP